MRAARALFSKYQNTARPTSRTFNRGLDTAPRTAEAAFRCEYPPHAYPYSLPHTPHVAVPVSVRGAIKSCWGIWGVYGGVCGVYGVYGLRSRISALQL